MSWEWKHDEVHPGCVLRCPRRDFCLDSLPTVRTVCDMDKDRYGYRPRRLVSVARKGDSGQRRFIRKGRVERHEGDDELNYDYHCL